MRFSVELVSLFSRAHTAEGWSEAAAAAVLGNAWSESSGNPSTNNVDLLKQLGMYDYIWEGPDGKDWGCIGLWQWCRDGNKRGTQYNELVQYGTWNDVSTQVAYLDTEEYKGFAWYLESIWGPGDRVRHSGWWPEGENSVYVKSWEDFKTGTDVKNLTLLFGAAYEVPCTGSGCWEAEGKTRYERAQTIYETFSGKTVSSTSNCTTAEVCASADWNDIKAFIDKTVNNPSITYAWGASGPDHYDCSGFTNAAFKSVGIELGARSTANMWTTFPGKYQNVGSDNGEAA